jgi:predicted MFS family arabinose efflux permease
VASVAERADAAAAGPPSTGYSAYVTFVMALVFMLAATDRNIMSILLVPIQDELKVSDTAMGALTGTAYSLVYATAALPLARLADRGNRRNLIAAAVAVWSLMTSACGLATSFLTLLLARIGVAVGESATGPSIMSMVGDLYPRSRRGLAIGCITIGSAVGIGLGAYLAGLLNDLHGWRTAFLVMGLPGVVVGLLMFVTVKEPKRGAYEDGAGAQPDRRSSLAALRYLFSVPTIPRLLAAKLLLQVAFGGFLVWAPAFFMRVHGLTTTEMSAGFGLVVGTSAILSAIIAGIVSDRLSKGGERWRAYYCAIVLAGGVPFAVLTMIAPTPMLAFAALFVMSLITGGATSASITAGLGVVRPEMRGFMTAVMSFVIAVVGGGLGPVFFGALTDALKPTYGDEAIRFTLLTIPALWAASAALFYISGRTTDHDAAMALRGPLAP